VPPAVQIAIAVVVVPLVAAVLATVYICIRYVPRIMRIFEERPLFLPPDEPPIAEAENVRFRTSDGLWLQGSWLPAPNGSPRGTILFCHEYLSNRWSCRPYCEPLRAAGFDILVFDFRNHGESDQLDEYRPMQWVTDYEVLDVRAALAHARAKRGGGLHVKFGLFGVSRGGGAALLAAAEADDIAALVTDGAFPTHTTQVTYMQRWVGIYSRLPGIYRLLPVWYFALVGWFARWMSALRHGCRFPNVERAVRRIGPRPLLMIHGEKDSYIGPEIAQSLFRQAAEPKEIWIVPDAKHNGSYQAAPDEYARRLQQFFCTNLADTTLNGLA
jgi:pimeloyl-ACP methyl ester carboxylesterase